MTMLKTAPGDVLDGRFLLKRELARGGMSTLYQAEDLAEANQPVVVKVPLPMFSSGVGGWSIFQREEEIGRQLDHPYVLHFLPLPRDRRRSYVATEFVPGRTLADLIAEQGRLQEGEALALAAKICEAVEHVHAHGVVHYDLKPANVMVCPDGTIRLIDFGLAHAASTSRFAFGGAPPAIGSAGYVAPEQVRRRRGQKSVDLYAIGALLYEMLTGRTPFGSDDAFAVGSARLVGDPPAPRALNPAISPAAEEIILRALRRDPAERYPDVEALRAAVTAPAKVVVTGLCEQLQPPTPWRRFRRRARYIAMVSVVPVVAQIVLFVLLWRHLAHK
jgi:serine/threonine protein kinase